MIRKFIAPLASVLAMALAPAGAFAQGYPNAPITVVIPLAPGDAADTAARTMSAELSRELDTPIVVQNKPGAGGSIGVQAVATAKKDGYTLLFAQNGPLTIRRVFEPSAAGFDPLKELTPLALTTRTPSILVVRKDAPYNTFQEMVAYAKKHPGAVHIGNAGPGSAGDVSVHIINSQAGTQITSVSYRGAAPAVTDALGGQVEGVILGLGALSAHLKSGALKPIAISSPFPSLPKVPTLSKLGYKQDILGVWLAFLAPAGVPQEVVDKLMPALDKVAHDPKISDRLLPLGIAQDWVPGPQLAKTITGEYETVQDITQRLKGSK